MSQLIRLRVALRLAGYRFVRFLVRMETMGTEAVDENSPVPFVVAIPPDVVSLLEDLHPVTLGSQEHGGGTSRQSRAYDGYFH